jgi:hypothetical protein
MKKRRENIKNSLKNSLLKKMNEKERAKGQKKEPKGKRKEPKGKNSDRKEPHKDTSGSYFPIPTQKGTLRNKGCVHKKEQQSRT